MSLYGELVFNGKDLANLGFLNNRDITDIMQLILKIRNTDFSIQFMLDTANEIETLKTFTLDDKNRIQNRMKRIIEVVERLMREISKRNKALSKLLPSEVK